MWEGGPFKKGEEGGCLNLMLEEWSVCARNGERGGWLVGGFILRVVNASR